VREEAMPIIRASNCIPGPISNEDDARAPGF
jgi:hypothetical protein